MRVAVCDDEIIFLDKMEYYLKTIPGIESVDKYDSISELNRMLAEKSYDLIFMDIEWKGQSENGTKYAAQVNLEYPNIQIVFITAYNDRFSESIFLENVNLCGYLVKPIKHNNLQFFVEKAQNNIKKRQSQKIVVQYKGVTETIPFPDIVYMESKAHQLYINTVSQQILVYKKLDDYENLLNEAFVRIHKSYMVNMNYIKRIERNAITLKDGVKLPISKNRYQIVRDKFFKFISEQL